MKKRNRVLALTMAAAMSASLLAGCGSSTQQGGAAASSEALASTTAAADGEEDNIIRVGVVCSMTGGSAIYGEGAQNAIDMAVEEINGGTPAIRSKSSTAVRSLTMPRTPSRR